MPRTLVPTGRPCSPLDGTAEKIHSASPKINASQKSPVEKLCDVEIYALSVLGYIGSIPAPDTASLEAEAHALQCTTASPYNAIPTSLLCVGSVCGLGPNLLGIHTLTLAARCGTAANSNTLTKSLKKSSSSWEKSCSHFCSQLRFFVKKRTSSFHNSYHRERIQKNVSLGSQWQT